MKNPEEIRPDYTKNWLYEKKALRDTRVRNVHEVGVLKRAQEMRIDKLRESHGTIQELTSQIQELQERVNYVNDSPEFQDVVSICSGKLFHVPSQPAVVPSPRSVLSRDQSLQPDTWNLSGTQGNFFGNPRAATDSSQILYQGHSSLYESKCFRWNPVAEEYRETCGER